MKLAEQFNRVPLALLWLCVYLIRSLIFNTVSINDVLLMGILAGLTAFYKMRLEDNKIKELYNEINKLKENDTKQEKLIQDTNNSVASLKVSSSLRNVR